MKRLLGLVSVCVYLLKGFSNSIHCEILPELGSVVLRWLGWWHFGGSPVATLSPCLLTLRRKHGHQICTPRLKWNNSWEIKVIVCSLVVQIVELPPPLNIIHNLYILSDDSANYPLSNNDNNNTSTESSDNKAKVSIASWQLCPGSHHLGYNGTVKK